MFGKGRRKGEGVGCGAVEEQKGRKGWEGKEERRGERGRGRGGGGGGGGGGEERGEGKGQKRKGRSTHQVCDVISPPASHSLGADSLANCSSVDIKEARCAILFQYILLDVGIDLKQQSSKI